MSMKSVLKLQNSEKYPEKINFKEMSCFLVQGYIGIGNIPILGNVVRNMEFPGFPGMYPTGNYSWKHIVNSLMIHHRKCHD